MDPPVPELELPECPVCLQSYDGDTTTPRVLACGHSVCETCLTDLPKPYPHTLRCPACTQLVNYPHPQGPSALPKNIDLLRLIQNPNPPKPPKPNKSNHQLYNDQFIPNLWSNEFNSKWKQWVLPEDSIWVESGINDLFFRVLYGRIVKFEDSLGMPIRCLMKCDQKVSLVRVGLFQCQDDSRFRFSYVAKILQVLCGMGDRKRGQLALILRTSLKLGRTCKVYGLWYNKDDEGVYIVCGRHSWSLLKKLEDLESRSFCRDEEKMHMGIKDMSCFAMIGMEICETVRSLLSDGLMTGSLALSWFDIDDFGHVYIDFNEVLVTGRRVHRIISEALSVKQKTEGEELEVSLKGSLSEAHLFVSPELLFELLQKEGIDKYAVSYGSDVWSLCCVLLYLLVGKPFIEEMDNYLCCFIRSSSDEKGSDFMELYMGWLEKVKTLLETRLGSEFLSLKEYLYKGLDFDPKKRLLVTDIWKRIRELIVKPNFDLMVNLERKMEKENTGHCLVLGELCQLLNGIAKDGDNREDVDQVAELRIERDLIEGISTGHVKCIDLKGHRDCITGLAVGGDFLFSSSFDKTVSVWSLEDFTHVHSFKGHEHRVMALVFVDDEQQPLCISGDNGGGICIWGITIPFSEEPIKKLYEEKDWRYSGIHALAISRTGYFYTGSGDKSIKAWSMLDYTQVCTMNGHKSVVSTLAVCNGVLYSGSWDGTVRLWCLINHSPLTVLGEDTLGNVASVLSLAADGNMLIAAHENGSIKIWCNDVLLKSTPPQDGAIFSVSMEGKWLFTGGWSKTISVQELSGEESQVDDVISIGSIACDSVVTSLLYRQGKLFVGQADRVIKVYHHG